MEIFIAILVIVVSLVLLLVGGNKLVDSSVAIASKLKIPTSIIGATLVSIGTTIPEILVTIFSVSSNADSLAIGNAIGSSIFNLCVIGGILFLFSTVKLKKGFHLDYLLLFVALIILFVFGLNNTIPLYVSIALLVLFAIFITINIVKAVKTKNEPPSVSYNKSIFIYLLIFVISAACVGVGAYFLVDKAQVLAKMLGLSDIFIGLTIISLGTSLPELVTTITSIKKKQAQLGVGNIVGACFINTTLLIGLAGAINGAGGLLISNSTLFVSIPLCILSSLVLILPLIIKKKSAKWQGALLATFYLLYYAFLILSALKVISF